VVGVGVVAGTGAGVVRGHELIAFWATLPIAVVGLFAVAALLVIALHEGGGCLPEVRLGSFSWTWTKPSKDHDSDPDSNLSDESQSPERPP
jgi:hypothetical protein